MAAIARLSAADVTSLALDAPDTPMHQAVLASLEAAPLLGPEGTIDIAGLRAHVSSRLDRTPELRQVVRRPGLLRGRQLLVDDPGFRIEDHVLLATLPAPGGEAAALEFAAGRLAAQLDRSKPLWTMWVLAGFAADRLGLLVVLHHAIADGPAMVNMLAQIFDLEPVPTARQGSAWVPGQGPTGGQLLADSAGGKLRAIARSAKAAAHPIRKARKLAATYRAMREELRQASGGPRSSINRPTGIGRRAAAMHVSLGAARVLAHRLDVKLNDVFLFLIARTLRRVLLQRGERVDGLSLHMSVAVTQPRVRETAASGNHTGTVTVPIPIGVQEPHAMLDEIASVMAAAKSRQMPSVSMTAMAVLAQAGIARAFIRRQTMLNVLTTNLPGPPVPLYLAGARVFSPVALAPIAGNVTLSFAALSYNSELALGVVADAAAWPDFAELQDAMSASWRDLEGIAERPVEAAG